MTAAAVADATLLGRMIDFYGGKLTSVILRKWAWMSRTEALLSRDDLAQIVALAMIDAASMWPRLVEENDYPVDPLDQPGLTWTLLMKRAEWNLLAHGVLIDRAKIRDSIDAAFDRFEEDGYMSEEMRTAVTVDYGDPGSTIIHHTLVDYIARMPDEDQAYLALRFYEDRSFGEMSRLLGQRKQATFDRLYSVRKQLRAFALCQVKDQSVRIPMPRSRNWAPSDDLLAYLSERYGPAVTLEGWLVLARAAYVADIDYLCSIMGGDRTVSASAPNYRRTSDADAAEIARRAAAGESHKQIGAALGIAAQTVGKVLRRRAV